MISVRPATYAEVRPVQQAVLRPAGPSPGDAAPPADWLHVAVVEQGVVVGACSAGPAPWPHPELGDVPVPQWQLRGMAVLPAFRGGAGARLLAAIVQQAQSAGAAGMWAQARVAAVPLYVRGGWSVLGPEWLKPGIGPHRWITLDLTRAGAPQSAADR